MQQQIRTQTPKKNKPAASLIISWLIILGVYLLLRLVFVIFGFHLAPVVLGGCLAVLPYIAGAFYLFNTPAAHRVGGCVLGILLPSIVEKLVLYFFGASLYGIPLADVSGVDDGNGGLNIQIGNAGTYEVVVTVKVAGTKLAYTLDFYEATAE